MSKKIAVIGVGNMAKAILNGIISSRNIGISNFYIYDKYEGACEQFSNAEGFQIADGIFSAVNNADYILLSVKPQNFPEVLEEVKKVHNHENKIYITIAAGITSQSVSETLGGALVIRVLPNLPMTIGMGVSAICKNEKAAASDFEFVKNIFLSSGSITVIDESEMNRIIGVTSSSPAYVFKFIESICKGAEIQGLDGDALIDTVCDVVIGSAILLKNSKESPSQLISKVASKGGTTERALLKLNDGDFEKTVCDAMVACTERADELGKH